VSLAFTIEARATLVVAVEVPFAFEAVMVNTVVDVGLTDVEPTSVDVEKEPGVMEIEEAFVMSHESVDD
jgi:hypothetical protein